jgi:uncharacterized protein YoxC
MDTLIHADIFFFITTIALILIALGLIIALIYIIKILHNVFHVSEKVKVESDEIISDLKTLRGNVKEKGFRLQYVKQFIKRIFGRNRRSNK